MNGSAYASELSKWLASRSDLLEPGVAAALLEDATAEVEGFVSPVKDRALEHALRRSTDVTRYRVVDRRLYRLPRTRTPDKEWLGPAEDGFQAWLSRLISLVPVEVALPSFDFAVNLGDYPVRGAPIWTPWSCEGHGNARYPSGVHWESNRAVPLRDDRVRGDRRFDPESLTRPWAARLNRVVWRGSATGMYDRTFRGHRWRSLLGRRLGEGVPRLDLVRIAEAHPEILDAKIVAWPQVSPRLRARLEASYGAHAPVPTTWFLDHRYVINVDGNVATAGLLTFVGSGSTILKQDSPYRDWCGHRLRAGEHYLAVAHDLSDLVEVARAALEDPERGEAVATAGRRFAERFLTGTAVDYYALALLDRYAAVAPVPDGPGRGAIALA